MTSSKKFIAWLRLSCRFGHVTKVWQTYHFIERSYHNLNFIRIWPEKTLFFEGSSWLKVNHLGVALGMAWKSYTSVAKGLKLKVRKCWGLIPTFEEVTRGKLLGGGSLFAPSLRIKNRVNVRFKAQKYIYICTTWKFKNVKFKFAVT